MRSPINHIILTILLVTSLIVSNHSCIYGQSCDINGRKHFQYEDIKIILDNNKCNSCHFAGSFQSSWVYDSYEHMFALDKCGKPIISHGNINKSALIDKINGGQVSCGFAMPLGSKPISDQDLLAIESWIEFGAPEICVSEYQDIKNILTVNKCNDCHNNNTPSAWRFDTYGSIFQKNGSSLCPTPNIVKYDAKNSFLYQKLVLSVDQICGQPMTVEGKKMNTLDIVKIRDWIDIGAPQYMSALPVSLSRFDVKYTNNNLALISWQTQVEINTESFIIEHSMDGMHFTPISSVQAKYPTGGDYIYYDDNQAPGFHYYRLNMLDFDNSNRYSPLRVIRISNKEEIFTITPSIFNARENQTLNIIWYPADNRQLTNIELMDINGQLHLRTKINIGENQLIISNLKAGVYYLVISNYNNKNVVKRIVII